MTTFSEEILARYKKVEIETDAFGRAITVGRLRPFDAMRVRRIMGTEDRGIITEFLVAASVRSVTVEGGHQAVLTPPKNEGDMQAVMNMLDEEGFAAAAKAYVRLYGLKPEGDGEGDGSDDGAENEGTLDKAKN